MRLPSGTIPPVKVHNKNKKPRNHIVQYHHCFKFKKTIGIAVKLAMQYLELLMGENGPKMELRIFIYLGI